MHTYLIKKRVTAKNIAEALRIEKKTEATEILLDDPEEAPPRDRLS